MSDFVEAIGREGKDIGYSKYCIWTCYFFYDDPFAIPSDVFFYSTCIFMIILCVRRTSRILEHLARKYKYH